MERTEARLRRGPRGPASIPGQGLDVAGWAREAEADARRLSESRRCAVVLPAGGGKTELIARAVKINASQGGCQLVLTHTHAGVGALRSRLQHLGVPRAAYNVSTLDGFALRFTRHFPILAGTTIVEPDGDEWEEVRVGAGRVLRSRHVRRVLQQSYSGLYVDEYQDCSSSQHGLVLRLAEEMPTRIVGDPLQGIFEFSGIVDWKREVAVEFPRLSVAEIPWRWLAANPALGERLARIRRALVEGSAFELANGAGLQWLPMSPENQITACLTSTKTPGEVVAVHKWPGQCHKLAKKLKGLFSSMEELAGKHLLRTARAVDAAEGATIAVELLEFARSCMTKLPSGVKRTAEAFQEGKRAQTRATRRHREVYLALNRMADEPSPRSMLAGMDALETLPEPFIHRRECWNEMKRALRILDSEARVTTLEEAVLQVRDRTRRLGRRTERRTISRTLLVKGLEYDHAVVLDADLLKDPRELYVALTRGRRAVTVLSKRPRFRFPPVEFE